MPPYLLETDGNPDRKNQGQPDARRRRERTLTRVTHPWSGRIKGWERALASGFPNATATRLWRTSTGRGSEDIREPSKSASGVISQRGNRLSAKGSTKEDGMLQMREVYGLVMNADLVVLSACQTGTGILERAEGVIGLTRPFFFAGSRSVISTLWPIKDKAARAFMLKFYDEFVCGKSIGESLRFAKIKMIRSSWSHPSYWAGFMLNGNPFIRNEN